MGFHHRPVGGANSEDNLLPLIAQSSAVERCSEDGRSRSNPAPVASMISYRSPANGMNHGAPVQVISVPVNSLERAVPTFRNESVFDEKHAVERLGALTLKERANEEDNLKANRDGGSGSTRKVEPSEASVVKVGQVGVSDEGQDSSSPVPESPVSSSQKVIPTVVTSLSSSTAALPMGAPTSAISPSMDLPPPPPRQRAMSSSGDSVASSTASFRSQRQMFLVFVKILFKCLDQANVPDIRLKAKKIVAECTRRNRMGDPAFTPLMEAVEKRLRGYVGEVLWRRALLLLHHYMSKNNTP